jgi:transcriptional regulator with XRE-family HTH domain
MNVSTFGERLRTLRNKRKLTQKDLGEKFKMSESAIGMYERNEREPSFSLVQGLANYFEVTVDYLIGRTSDPSPTAGLSIAYYGGAKTAEEKEFLDEQLEIFRIRKAIREQEKKNNE